MRNKKELLKEIKSTTTIGYQLPILIEVLIDIRDLLITQSKSKAKEEGNVKRKRKMV